MGKKFMVPLVLVALGSLPWREAQARLWIVDGYGSGDFTQIQPAIDASQDGDVILVRSIYFGHPLYDPFVLSKGVMIRASDTPFTVAMTPPDHVLVQNIGAPKRGGIAGMSIVYDPQTLGYPLYVLVEVHSSGGEVVLENLSLTIKDTTDAPYFGAQDALLIQDCSNVSITGLVAIREPNYSNNAAVRIDRSSVRISDVTVNVGEQLTPGVVGTP